jgi:hypothetical protein
MLRRQTAALGKQPQWLAEDGYTQFKRRRTKHAEGELK